MLSEVAGKVYLNMTAITTCMKEILQQIEDNSFRMTQNEMLLLSSHKAYLSQSLEAFTYIEM